MEAAHAEFIAVSVYRDMFEQMKKVISDERDTAAVVAHEQVLNGLFNLLGATERRLTMSKCGSSLEPDSWLFHFEAMIQPLWSSVQDREEDGAEACVGCRVSTASMIINACLPLIQSFHYCLEEAIYSDPVADHAALLELSAAVERLGCQPSSPSPSMPLERCQTGC